MKTITKQVYSFSELQSEVQEKVMNDYYDDMGYQDNNDMFSDTAKELLKMIGFSNVEIEYSLSYCQGDGFSFLFDSIYNTELVDLLKFWKANKPKEQGYKILEELHERIYAIIKDYEIPEKEILDPENEVTISIRRTNYHYYHKRSKTIEVYFYTDIKDKEAEALEDILKQIYLSICEFMEDLGYKYIYDKMSIEDFSDISDSNDWYYLPNGKMEN